MELPDQIAEACAPLFEVLPIAEAMPTLRGGHGAHVEVVEAVLRSAALCDRPHMAAGLWLYVSDLDRSHTVSQAISDEAGSFWHGIMHRREGDFSNGHYWIRRAERHPLLTVRPELDPHGLIDAVARSSTDRPELVARQREEWQALFEWCANNL